MRRIFSIYFILLSFLGQAQNFQNEISVLQNKINQFEKSGDTNSKDYADLLNNLAMKYFQTGQYDDAESLYLESLKVKKKILGINTLEYANTLNNLAYLYNEVGKNSESEKLFLESLDIYKTKTGERNVNYATLTNNLGLFYLNTGNYEKAEKLISYALEIRKELLGVEHPDYAASLNNISSLYSEQGNYSKAEPLLLEATRINKILYGESSNIYLVSLNNLAQLYSDHAKYSQAESLYLEVLEKRKKVLGEKHPDYALTLNNLAVLYTVEGKYSEAEPLYLNSLEIREEVLGKEHPDYAVSLSNIAQFYHEQNNYSKSEAFYLESLQIKKDILGKEHPSYALTLDNLAVLYNDEGKYLKAEKLYLEALEIKKVTLGKEHPDYASTVDNLAGLYEEQGKYSEAEPLYLIALNIRMKILGENHPDYASSLNNLASSYQDQGKYSEAESLYIKSIGIIKEILGENHPTYLLYLNNLAVLYNNLGRYSDAEILYLKVLEIRKKVLGENNPDYANSLSNLASVYYDQKIYSKSESLLLESLNIIKQNLGTRHPSYALTLNNLGHLYQIQGKYNEAESSLLRSLEIRKEALGENHPDYLTNLYDIAYLYRQNDLNSDATIYFKKFIENNQKRTANDIYGLTEKGINGYLKFKKNYLAYPLSFLYDFPTNFPTINSSCYENELIIKNLTLRNQERIKKKILKSGNQMLRDKYQQFLANKIEISKLQELPLLKRPSIFASLIDETEQIEKELSKESSSFLDYKNAMSFTLNDIKNKLTSKEVAVDLVSFKYYKKTVSDSLVYAAFIVKKDSKAPKFISLFEEKQLDFLLGRNKIQLDSTRIDKQYLEKTISDLFLKPLEKELQGITTIYLSPSGLGHQIDFAALPLSRNQTLGEKYNLHILSSPAELIDYKVASLDKNNNIELLLYGGIDYNKSNPKTEIDKEIVEPASDIAALRTQSGISGFDYLNGTNNEINQIQLKGNLNGFTTTVYKESEATEESIKQLDGRTTPYVLHLATHGFFFPDPKQEIPNDIFAEQGKSKIYKASDDPMMRSGLLLAGANNYWGKSAGNTTTEDGILTASEISNLDLSACQLVVLSACETGLGEVKGSEGVFGLQRAFKMAGVKNIIMSLWKVPDTQTAELFDIFYSECFAGKTIHEAFQSAQSQMKAKYSPYYWAGFVLLE